VASSDTREGVDETLTADADLSSSGGGAPTPGDLGGPRPGAHIGRYVVEATIGTGGMGVVVAARDPGLERQVALKVVRPDVGDRAYRQRLVREARAMAQLEHQNVVRVYDAGEERGEVFVAMELVRGGTLGQWMRAERRPWREVLSRFIAAGRGLEAAHAAGLVHRDFKPDNVLVSGADGRVCVTDFGLAVSGERRRSDQTPSPAAVPADAAQRTQSGLDETLAGADETLAASAETVDAARDATLPGSTDDASDPSAPLLGSDTWRTRTGALVGTPAYMAPEQHRGHEVDARADVFAFAVSLYEGLYRERPFRLDPEDGPITAWTRAFERGVRPVPAGRSVPAAVRRVVLRGLAAEPDARWPDMTTFIAALEHARGARRRLAATVVGLALVGLTAALAIRGTGGRDGPPPPPAGYDAALAQLRVYDVRAARALERVTAAAPRYAPAWIALARAHELEQDFPRAREAVARASALVPAADRARHLEIEAVQAELDDDWDLALARYQADFQFHPHDLDLAAALATAQVYGGHPKDALATIDAAREVGDDLRFYVIEGAAADQIDDWDRVEKASDRGIELGTARHADGIVDRALLRRAIARAREQRFDDAIADLDHAKQLAERAGDLHIQARQFTARTRVLAEKGDPAAAADAAEAGLAIDRRLGDPHGLAVDLLNASSARDEAGQADRALELYEEAFEVHEKIDAPDLLGNTLVNYGSTLTELGRWGDADRALHRAVEIARKRGFDNILALATEYLGNNDFARGDLVQAEAEGRQAAIQFERLGDQRFVTGAYGDIAMALFARGDLAGALRTQEHTVEIARRVSDSETAAAQAWQAFYLDADGQQARAAELALAAAEVLHASERSDEELLARAVAAAALADLHRRADAEAQLAAGRALFATQRHVDVRVNAARLLLRAAVAVGHRDQAREILAAVPKGGPVPWVDALAAEARRARLTP